MGPVLTHHAEPGRKQHGVGVMPDPELALGFREVRSFLLDLRGKVREHFDLAVLEGDVAFQSCETKDGVPVPEIQELCDKFPGRCTLRRGLAAR